MINLSAYYKLITFVGKQTTIENRPNKKSVNALEENPTADSEKYVHFFPGNGSYESDFSSGNDSMVPTTDNSINTNERLNLPIKIENFSSTLLLTLRVNAAF